MNDLNSLSHTKWKCKYHIVFAPKFRRKVFYGEKRREVGEILRTLYEEPPALPGGVPWAAQIVLDLRRKKRGLGIFGLGRKNDTPKLHCILPCEGQEDKWPRFSQERYRDILKQADSVVYVSREYDDQCMLRRNHVLVDFSSVVLAVYNGGYRSGMAATVRYARRLGREVIVIDPTTRSVTHEKTAP